MNCLLVIVCLSPQCVQYMPSLGEWRSGYSSIKYLLDIFRCSHAVL